MSLYRFFCNPLTEPVAQLDAAESHHLSGVLRLQKGDKAELFDGNGTEAVAVVISTSKKKAALQIESIQRTAKPVTGRIIIATSIAKGERFDWLVTKCTELGADRICPVLFERTVKQSKNPKAVQRWQKLAISAAKQSRQVFLPQIDAPLPLAQALENLKADYPKARILAGTPDKDKPSLISKTFGNSDIIAVIGPEGGITQAEQTLLESYNAECVRLTDTILRIETAAIAFTSILAAQRANK